MQAASCLTTLAIYLLLGRGHAGAEPGFQLPPEFEISLFASEPDVVDPVAICFGANGDAYVVEMRDYPYGFDGTKRKPGGSVRLLRDTDGDGRADFSSIFADGLSFPTSITPWRDGVLVAAPPQVLFLADSDGDDIADRRIPILDGFKLGVTDGNLSGLQWGIDNRVHGAKGGSPAKIESPLNRQAPLSLGNRDFAFDPDSGEYAPSGATAAGFGLTSDPFGRWFANYNISHLKMRVIPWRYLKDRPWLPDFPTMVDISDHGESARLFPTSEAETRPNHPEQAGHFTAAAGMLFIPEGSFHASLDRCILSTDVVANLVHRDVITADGPIFKGSRHAEEQGRDFLTSSDNSFRPTDIEFGPDGALYLLDMQREVIEHPDYIPDNARADLDLRAGDDRGRIYRIVPAGKRLARGEPSLSSRNPWSQETAHRQLVEDPPEAFEKPGELGRPDVRARLLWVLHSLGQLSDDDVEAALDDPDPAVRETALAFASQAQAWKVRTLAEADEPRVRFQAALALGEIDHPRKIASLAKLLIRDADEPWTRRAILTATSGPDLLLALPDQFDHPEAIRELAHLSAASSTGAAWVSGLRPSAPLLEGLYSGWRQSGQAPEDFRGTLEGWAAQADRQTVPALLDLLALFQEPPPDRVQQLIREAELAATDRGLSDDERLAPIALIGRAESKQLYTLLSPRETGGIQRAALASLRESRDRELGRELIARWSGLSPSIRREAIDTLLSDIGYHKSILDGIEDGAVTLGELNLDLEQRRTLLRWSTPFITLRAKKLFPDEEYLNRKAVVSEWLQKLPERGDAAQGKITFQALCSTCHRAGGLGVQVGPDLDSVSHRSAEDLATHIIDPNMALNPKYISTTAEAEDGRRLTGILVAEDERTITLLLPAGVRQTLARPELKSLRTEARSLMPEGLESAMQAADLRNLIEFLQHGVGEGGPGSD